MRKYMKKVNTKKRIYTDGVFDLFHRGHLECFKYIKNKYPRCQLIVGVISDKDAENYKRMPVINEEDRLEIIKGIKYVDDIIFPGPLIMTNEFLDENKINLVMHGFADEKDKEKQTEFFADIQDKFELMPYYKKSSTTKILEKIKS